MSEFKNGDLVNEIHINSETSFVVGSQGCTSIHTIMENGQMAGVPWFEVYKNDELHSKWNGALILGVEI